MRISLVVLTSLLAVTSLSAQPGKQSTSDAQAWTRYTVEKGDFSVTMPKVPVLIFSKILSSLNIDITVVKGGPGEYTQSAIEAARKIKFVPATKDGVPVSMWMQLEYRFPF